ncbi:alpha/beta fold hydrolase [Roseospira goensis]|uniref:Dipeptidyl aminopeptidase/acylaminoacyl peptidase n=1 Tax=Roseospira goensis TaxID=391922 RepID=A0A7W6WKE8_9PROT|nr:dipeptidyl aminopeptidase/acylaminoacyl peptidase [Roseospira goensis]
MTTVLTIVVVLVAVALFLDLALHRALRAPRLPGTTEPADVGVHAIAVRLLTANDRRLFAWYCPPPAADRRRPAPALAAVHGWGGTADGLLPLARVLQAEGYGVLLIDTRCHGRSEDDTFASLPRFAEDLSHGVDWLRARPEIDAGRIAVMGHSVGAGAALLTGSRRRDLVGVVSLAAFAHPEEVMRAFVRTWGVPYRPIGWAINRYVERVIGHRFRDIAPLSTVARQHAPVLLLHGGRDRVVPVRDMERLRDAARAAGCAVQAVTVPGVDHEGVDPETGTSVIDRGADHLRAFLAGVAPVRAMTAAPDDLAAPAAARAGRAGPVIDEPGRAPVRA